MRCFLPLSWWLCFRCFMHVSSCVNLTFLWLFFLWPAFLVLCVGVWSRFFVFGDCFVSDFIFLPFSYICLFWPRYYIVRWGKLVFVLDLLSALDLYWVSVTMKLCFSLTVEVLGLDHVLFSSFFYLVWLFMIFNN